MVFLADEVAEADLPVFAVAFLVDVISCLCVDIAEPDARFDHGLRAEHCLTDDVVDFLLFGGRLFAVESPCHVGAVSFPYTAHVNENAFACLEGSRIAWFMVLVGGVGAETYDGVKACSACAGF